MWYKICAPISHIKIKHETKKAMMLESSRTLFWYPKKLLDFSDPENIVLTIEENMDIAGVGNYKALTKLLDGCSFISASYPRHHLFPGCRTSTMSWGGHEVDDCFPGDPFDFGDH